MASKSVLNSQTHAHCETCGSCFLYPLEAQLHRCPEPVRPDILAVMLLEMKPWDRSMFRRMPDGFQTA